MKIIITGKDSYIGNHICDLLLDNGHHVDILDMLSDRWKDFDFAGYDAVVHVAAIVHDDAKISSEDLFYKVNTELPFQVASLAKENGIKSFVFLSTMAVYGCDKALPLGNVITKDTELKPVSLYGKTKLLAEEKLLTLNDSDFKVALVRPPNVYGKNCKGNYIGIFHKIVSKLPVFPKAFLSSRQSMLYIDNLSELIRLIIENRSFGVFTPQDDVIPSTCELVEAMSKAINKKIKMSRMLGALIKPLKFIGLINKLYGGVYYCNEISDCFDNTYQIVSFEDGIKRTFD